MNVISREAEATLEVRKSRFLARTFRVISTNEAMAAVKRIRDERRDADHNCWAWRIGPAAEQARYNDDGEPSGTAGPPILQVLSRRGMTNILLVVTRYFGGTKLGAGGLARAYGDAAKAAIEASEPRPLRLLATLRAELPHAALPAMEHFLAKRGFEIVSREFGEVVVLVVRLPADEEPTFRSFHLGLVSGRHPCRELGRDHA
ncbi:MAG: YigZ family protein [Candidatus Aminicenantes bacterium]|nr:YigZ family protein [Candidatus Aminicenantes bacterium]